MPHIKRLPGLLLRCVRSLMAQSGSSLRRINSVAFGAKRTLSQLMSATEHSPLWLNRSAGQTPNCHAQVVPAGFVRPSPT